MVKPICYDDAIYVRMEEVQSPNSDGGAAITEGEVEFLHDYYEECYGDGDFKIAGRFAAEEDFEKEVRAILKLVELPRKKSSLQRLSGGLLAPFPNGRDIFDAKWEIANKLAQQFPDRIDREEIHGEIWNQFHAHDLGTLEEGECYYRSGEDCQPSAVGAPHEGFDLYTSNIARSFAEMNPYTAVVYCEGFREGRKYDVNRSSGREGWSLTARQVMKKYESHIERAYSGIPRIFHEIHGKGDKQHPYTEITFIGDDDRCGWSQEVREQAKRMWETGLHEKVVVHGIDPESYYGHTEYQADGLAGIHGWCGVNVELSRTARDLWNGENLNNPDLSVQRAFIINGLSGLFTFAEETVQRHAGHRIGNYDDCFATEGDCYYGDCR